MDYEDKVCRAAAAHVCLAVGASRTVPSVLRTLADVTKQYIATVGVHAKGAAEIGGRTEVSAVDILVATKQMGPGGCSWRDLNEFAFNEVGPWQQPFHAEVPVLPARKRKLEHFATVGGGGGAGGIPVADDGRPPHIPPWLAPLPPKHTYKKTCSNAVKKTVDGATLRKSRATRKQDIAASLAAQTKLEQRAESSASSSVSLSSSSRSTKG